MSDGNGKIEQKLFRSTRNRTFYGILRKYYGDGDLKRALGLGIVGFSCIMEHSIELSYNTTFTAGYVSQQLAVGPSSTQICDPLNKMTLQFHSGTESPILSISN